MKRTPRLTLVLLLLLLAAAEDVPAGIDCVSKPSADVTLSFVRPGRVAEVKIKEGDMVEEGQLLARLDDDAERVQLDQLKAQAEHTEKISAAAADLAQKRVDLRKFEAGKADGGVSNWEIDHARLNVRVAEISLQLAQFEHEQDRRRYEEARVQVERMRLFSPIGGRVEQVDVEPGESAQALTPVVRVVKVDPLWVGAAVPTSLARQLRQGQSASADFPGRDGRPGNERLQGTVSYVSMVAVPASNTLRVRVEIPNAALRPAGERILVNLEPGQAAGGDTGSKEISPTEPAKKLEGDHAARLSPSGDKLH